MPGWSELEGTGGGWVRGRFEGVYVGRRVARAAGDAPGRHFEIEIRSGRLLDAETCPPPSDRIGCADEGAEVRALREHRQARIERVFLGADDGGHAAKPRRLFDVRIDHFELGHPAERHGVAYGTIVGALCASLLPTDLEALPIAPVEPIRQAPRDSEPSPPRNLRPATPRPVRHAQEVIAPDAHVVYARLKGVAVTLLLAALGLLIAGRCGRETALVWAAPLVGVILLRSITRRLQVRTTWLQRMMGGLIVAVHASAVGLAFESWWATGCRVAIDGELTLFAAPVIAAAFVRARAALVCTGLLWTALLCSWCGQLGGSACVPVAASAAESIAASAGADATTIPRPGTAPRTDSSGRWPAMPRAPIGPGGLPAGEGEMRVPAPGAVERSRAPVGPSSDGGSGSARGAREPAGPLDGFRAAEPSNGSVADAAASPAPPSERARQISGPSSQASRSAAASPSVPGGWVAPDHRRVTRDLFLISLEHANRVPADFYEAAGERRVHVPTDALFEPGGSQPSARGELQLARLAALLSLRPERRVVIDVHTDAGGSAEAQLALSRRRASAVQDWLLARGHVDGGQFRVVGVGSSRPLVPPDGGRGAQAPNRRLEVRLVAPSGDDGG